MKSVKQRKTIAARLRTLALSVLVVLALISVGAWVAWLFYPGHLDRFASELAARDREYLDMALRDAQQQSRSHPKVAVVQLQELLSELQDVRSRDMSAGLKVRAFDRLSAAAPKAGNLDLGIRTARDWVAFAPRDLNAKLRLAALLAESPNDTQESQSVTAEVYSLVPEMDSAADQYSLALLNSGDPYGFWRVQLEGLSYELPRREELLRASWFVFWDLDSGFSSEHRESVTPSLSPTGTLRFESSVPAGSVAVRIDPPGGLRFVMRNPTMTVFSQNRSPARYGISEKSFRSGQVSQVGNDLLSGTERARHAPVLFADSPGTWAEGPPLVKASNDPKFWWRIEKSPDESRVVFEADIVGDREILD